MSEASIQEKIVLNANANISQKEWAKDTAGQAKRNQHVYVPSGQYKCNLFVYEILLVSGVDIGTPNVLSWIKHPILFAQGKLLRPPTTDQWFDGKVPKVNLVGEGKTKDIKYLPGDIITNGAHIGFIVGDSKTVSANETEIVCNDWGFRENETETFKVFRVIE